MPEPPRRRLPGEPDLPLTPEGAERHPADDARAVPHDEPLDDLDPDDSPARPDNELLDEVFGLVVLLRGWGDTCRATRQRRYRQNPTSPGAIQLGEIEKSIRQTANLIDNYSEQLARDLRR